MRGIENGNAEPRPRRQAQFGRIGEMAVQDVGFARQQRQQIQKGAAKRGQLRLERLLGQIAGRGALQPQDAQLGADLLHRHGMVGAEGGGMEQPGQDIDARHAGQPGLRRSRAQDIGDVAARVLGQAIADRWLRDAATEGDVHHIHRNLDR